MEKILDAFGVAMPANPIEDLKVSISLDITEVANESEEAFADFKSAVEEEISSSSIDITTSYKEGSSYKADNGDLVHSKYMLNLSLKFSDDYEDDTKVYDLEKLLTTLQAYAVKDELDVKKLGITYNIKPGKPLPIDVDDID